jgi:hypothetical protein
MGGSGCQTQLTYRVDKSLRGAQTRTEGCRTSVTTGDDVRSDPIGFVSPSAVDETRGERGVAGDTSSEGNPAHLGAGRPGEAQEPAWGRSQPPAGQQSETVRLKISGGDAGCSFRYGPRYHIDFEEITTRLRPRCDEEVATPVFDGKLGTEGVHCTHGARPIVHEEYGSITAGAYTEKTEDRSERTHPTISVQHPAAARQDHAVYAAEVLN